MALLASERWRWEVQSVDEALHRVWRRTADDYVTRGGTDATTVHFVVPGGAGCNIVSVVGSWEHDGWHRGLLALSRELGPVAVIVATVSLQAPAAVYLSVHRPDGTVAAHRSLVVATEQGRALAEPSLMEVTDAMEGEDFPFLVPVMQRAVEADVWSGTWLKSAADGSNE